MGGGWFGGGGAIKDFIHLGPDAQKPIELSCYDIILIAVKNYEMQQMSQGVQLMHCNEEILRRRIVSLL